MDERKGAGLSWSQPSDSGNTRAPQKLAFEKKDPPKASAGVPAVKVSETSNMPGYVGSFVAGLAVGVLVGWGWVSLTATNNEREPVGANTPGTTAAPQLAPSALLAPSATSGEFQVSSTQPAGLSVLISAIRMATPTWVVVYESRGGAPGNALGATLFVSGQTEGSINLLRGTVAGQTYFVGQQHDDGDRAFSLHGDAAVLGKDSKPLLVQFKAQ